MLSVTEAQSRRHFDEVPSTWVDRYKTVPSCRTGLRVVVGIGGPSARCHGECPGARSGQRTLRVEHRRGALASAVVCVDTSWAMLHAGAVGQRQVEEILDGEGLDLDHRSDALVQVADSTRALAGAIRSLSDSVLAVSVLEYQPDPGDFPTRLVELIRPAGLIVFTVRNNRSIVRLVEGPVDAIAARAGRLLGVFRLTHRSYSFTRPFRSHFPWAQALTAAGAVRRELVPLRLGDTGLRATLRLKWLVVSPAP